MKSSEEQPTSSISNPNMSVEEWSRLMAENAGRALQEWSDTELLDRDEAGYQNNPNDLVTVIRKALKSNLYLERTLGQEPGPRCPICSKPCRRGNGEMHEVMVTRGDVMKNPLVTPMIYVAENCVIVHPGGCHAMAQHTPRGKFMWHGTKLLVYEGYNAVSSFLEGMYNDLRGLDTYDLAFLNALILLMGGKTTLSIDNLLNEIGKGET